MNAGLAKPIPRYLVYSMAALLQIKYMLQCGSNLRAIRLMEAW